MVEKRKGHWTIGFAGVNPDLDGFTTEFTWDKQILLILTGGS